MKRIDTNKTTEFLGRLKHGQETTPSREELAGMFKEQKSKLLKLKFELNEKKLKDFSQINKTKKDIARVMTALNNLK